MSNIKNSKAVGLLAAIILLIIVAPDSKSYATQMVSQPFTNAGCSSALWGDEFDGTELDRARWDVFRGNPVVDNGWLTLTDADIQSKATFSCGIMQGVIQSSDWKPYNQFTDSSFGFEMWTGANGQCHYGTLFKASGHLAILRSQPDMNGNCSGDPPYQAYPTIAHWDTIRAGNIVSFTLSWRSDVVTLTVSGNGQEGQASYVGQALPDVPLKIRLYAQSGESYKIDYIRLYGCHAVYLPIIMRQWIARQQPTNWAENRSYSTTCAEEDNVNVPIFSFPGQMSRFRVVATHPTYEVGMDNCAPDFSGCGSGAGIAAPQTTNTCQKLWDDGINVIEVCTEPSWWRPYSMSVVVDSQTASGHRLVLYRKIEGEASWPQFLVLYEDGNMRLKPHPPVGRSDVCFGSSVIIGPAAPAMRPYVDIQEVRIDPATLCLDIIYRDGGTARLCLSVSRTQAVAEVKVDYNTDNPFATFRSMWVSDGDADVDHIQNQDGDFPILDDWTYLRGPWWFFHRKARSTHNTSAPDIRIEVLD